MYIHTTEKCLKEDIHRSDKTFTLLQTCVFACLNYNYWECYLHFVL